MRQFNHITRGKSISCESDMVEMLRGEGYTVDTTGETPVVTGLPRLYLDATDRFRIADILTELADYLEESDPLFEEAYVLASRFVHPTLLGYHRHLEDIEGKRFTQEQIDLLIAQGVDPELIANLPRREG